MCFAFQIQGQTHGLWSTLHCQLHSFLPSTSLLWHWGPSTCVTRNRWSCEVCWSPTIYPWWCYQVTCFMRWGDRIAPFWIRIWELFESQKHFNSFWWWTLTNGVGADLDMSTFCHKRGNTALLKGMKYFRSIPYFLPFLNLPLINKIHVEIILNEQVKNWYILQCMEDVWHFFSCLAGEGPTSRRTAFSDLYNLLQDCQAHYSFLLSRVLMTLFSSSQCPNLSTS